ncbi:carbohydrate kinase family protein [Frateuria aurantia]
MKPFLVVGEVNPDLVFTGCSTVPQFGQERLAGDFQLVPGSSSMICAMGMARLGRPVAFCGLAGQDSWGEYCRTALRAAGVDCEALMLSPGVRTGVTVAISDQQDRALLSYVNAASALRIDQIPDGWLRSGAHLHIASYFLQSGVAGGLPDLLRRARSRGMTVSLDPGFDPTERWRFDLETLLPLIDVFLPNHIELAAITGEADPEKALAAVSQGSTLTVLKCGGRGVMVVRHGRIQRTPAFEVEVVDTTGAGDSFDAGFLHAWLDERRLEACIEWGAACGALSTRAIGGTSAQASAVEVREFLGRQSAR